MIFINSAKDNHKFLIIFFTIRGVYTVYVKKGGIPSIKLRNAAWNKTNESNFLDGTQGKAVRTRAVVAQREHVAGAEVHEATAFRNERNTRPVVAVYTDIHQKTVIEVAIARSREENGLATGFIFQDGTEVPTIIETSGYVPVGRVTRIITDSCETRENAIGRKAEPWRTRIVNALGDRKKSGFGYIVVTSCLIALGVPEVII